MFSVVFHIGFGNLTFDIVVNLQVFHLWLWLKVDTSNVDVPTKLRCRKDFFVYSLLHIILFIFPKPARRSMYALRRCMLGPLCNSEVASTELLYLDYMT